MLLHASFSNSNLLLDLGLIPQPLFYVVIGIIGAIIGSFLNVVIHRLPREESIVLPSSKCPRAALRSLSTTTSRVSKLRHVGRAMPQVQDQFRRAIRQLKRYRGLLFVATAWHDGFSFALPFDLVFVTADHCPALHRCRTHDPAQRDHVSGMVFASSRARIPYPMARHTSTICRCSQRRARRNAVLGSVARRRIDRRA